MLIVVLLVVEVASPKFRPQAAIEDRFECRYRAIVEVGSGNPYTIERRRHIAIARDEPRGEWFLRKPAFVEPVDKRLGLLIGGIQ